MDRGANWIGTMPTADLHTHSTASDGELAPAALVEKARALGLPPSPLPTTITL